MSCSSLWDQDKLAVGQLPTLQDMLCCCDEDALISVILDEQVARVWAPDQPSPKRRYAMQRRLRSTLASMRSLGVKRKKGRNRLVLPAESFTLYDAAGLIERRVGARLLFISDAPVLRRVLEAREAGLDCDAALPLRSFALDPWEIMLASRMWLGGSWCTRERYLVLASALWEMTFFGFEHDRVVAAQARARAQTRCVDVAPQPRADARTNEGDVRARRAASFGLEVPDPFAGAYRHAVAACISKLNRRAERDVCQLFFEVGGRMAA